MPKLFYHFISVPKKNNPPQTPRQPRRRAAGSDANNDADLVCGRVSAHADGYGFVITDINSEDIFLNRREMRRILPDDEVVARITNRDANGRCKGIVVKVVGDRLREIIGRFDMHRGGGVVRLNNFNGDIKIPAPARGAAKVGDLVAVNITQHPFDNRNAVGKVVAVLGDADTPGINTEIAIREYRIPHKWNSETDAELKSMGDALYQVATDKDALRARRDLRDIPLITIDGADARDFDDAVFAEPHKQGWRLVVAIADVSHYVQANSNLDLQARERGNSVYFPARVVPMLPEELSNGICSLNPKVERYCMVCDLIINKDGEVANYEFYLGLMRSAARLTYDQVGAILSADKTLNKKYAAVIPHIKNLASLTKTLLTARKKRNALDFVFPQIDIEFDARQKITHIGYKEINFANQMIEESMLAANVCAADFLTNNFDKHAIYRNHPRPDADSLSELRKFLNGLGLQLSGGEHPTTKDYAHALNAAHNTAISPMVQFALLRSLTQAIYADESNGHFALSYKNYTHFTSPIRRYSDLIVHRMIRQNLQKQKNTPPNKTLKQISAHCSFTERRAEDATREVIAKLKAEFMRDKIGQSFSGVISTLKEFGLFVQLDEIFVDGLVHISALGDDYFQFDAAHMKLIGSTSGEEFALGDKIKVKVIGVDVDAGKIDFGLNDVNVKKSKTRKS